MASELNVSTHQVLSFLEDLGKKVRGPSTVIGVSAAAKVRGRFRLAKPIPGDANGAGTGESAGGAVINGNAVSNGNMASIGNTVSIRNDGATVDGQASPAGFDASLPSLFLPPVAPQAAAKVNRSTAAFANPFAVPTNTMTATTAPRNGAATVGDMLRPPAAPAPPRAVTNRVQSVAAVPQVVSIADAQPDYDALWERRGISPADREVWVAGGLRLSEAEIADRCDSAGISPSDLATKLSGRTTLQRLRDGEATTSVWARIREVEQQPRRAGTKLTGRFQLS